MAYATDYTTLLTGSYWTGAEPAGPAPVFITYSFDTTAPASDVGHLAPSALATFTPFTTAQQTEAIQALNDWSSASKIAGGGSGIIFLQVAPGQGDINFAAYDFSSDPNAKNSGGEGYYPWGNWNYSTAQPGSINFGADLPGAGNILMNTAFETGGLFNYGTVLHEIGHALGLKHPTDAWTDYVPGYIDVVHNQWDPSVTYNPNFSIMSPGANTLTEPTSADWQAIQSIYGTPSQAAQQDASWSWNSTTDTLTQVLNAGGQIVRGISTNNNITGGSGNDIIYAIGSGSNNVSGGAGNDTLVGGSGISYLDGGAGADVLNGWFGFSYASYADSKTGVKVDLLNSSLNTGDAVGDSYLDIRGIVGSKYKDTLIADNNGETIIGGAGGDILYGGTGNSTFGYNSIKDSKVKSPDTIKDFHTGDLIDLSRVDGDTSTPGTQPFHFGATKGHVGDIVVTYDSVNNRTVINLYDNGTGTPDGVIYLSGNHTLSASDFILTPPVASPPASPAAFASAASALGSATSATPQSIGSDWPHLGQSANLAAPIRPY